MFPKKQSFFLTSIVILLIACNKEEATEETPCETNRYTQEIYTEVSRTNVKFSETQNLQSKPINLLMDIYLPVEDDFEKRPVIIWAFGGGFIGGSRLQMKSQAEAAARRGYVGVSIDYRLIDIISKFPDEEDVIKTVLMASNDMKAAIRFMRHDAANSDLYKIDPDKIFIGGVSAGSVLAIHCAYIDENEDLNQEVAEFYHELGGYKGDSGLPSTDSFGHKVSGVINLSGAISDLNMLDAGEPPIVSYHGDMDEIVPYEFASFKIGSINLIKLYGSKSIHEDAILNGIESELYTVQGGDHEGIYVNPIYENDRKAFTAQYFDFLQTRLCM